MVANLSGSGPGAEAPQAVQLSAAWFEARRGRITASLVPAILGQSPFATSRQAMRQLVRAWHRVASESSGNVATRYGQQNEETARLCFETEFQCRVGRAGLFEREGWAGCSPDGFVGSTEGLEIKCPFGARNSTVGQPYEFKSIFGPDLAHYYSQVAFSLWVTGRPSWHFYQWCPSHTRHEVVRLDRQYFGWQGGNLPVIRQFYQEFLAERELPAAQKHLDPLPSRRRPHVRAE